MISQYRRNILMLLDALRMDLRWGGGDINRMNARIPELTFEARDMVRRLMHPCQEALDNVG
jgi:hypothetical protein